MRARTFNLSRTIVVTCLLLLPITAAAAEAEKSVPSTVEVLDIKNVKNESGKEIAVISTKTVSAEDQSEFAPDEIIIK